jgi:Flp pilus assembly protein protease CpaA
MIISSENLFLLLLGLVWIIFAVLEDLRRREVDNIWNFSLIVFALAYRASVSAYFGNYWFFINGVIGLIIFLILGNLFYYARLFAGGDAKLVIALGAILPLDYNWLVNFKIFGIFILLFMVTGSVYAIIWSLFLVIKNWSRFSKEFLKYFSRYRRFFLVSLGLVILWILFCYFMNQMILIFIALIILLFPFLFVFSKAVEESCMIVSVSPENLTEGDWLYNDLVVNGNKIKADWEGVSVSELKLIKKYYRKNILIKQGIPFTPSFLFGFIGLLIVAWKFGYLIM